MSQHYTWHILSSHAQSRRSHCRPSVKAHPATAQCLLRSVRPCPCPHPRLLNRRTESATATLPPDTAASAAQSAPRDAANDRACRHGRQKRVDSQLASNGAMRAGEVVFTEENGLAYARASAEASSMFIPQSAKSTTSGRRSPASERASLSRHQKLKQGCCEPLAARSASSSGGDAEACIMPASHRGRAAAAPAVSTQGPSQRRTAVSGETRACESVVRARTQLLRREALRRAPGDRPDAVGSCELQELRNPPAEVRERWLHIGKQREAVSLRLRARAITAAVLAGSAFALLGGSAQVSAIAAAGNRGR